MASSPNDYTHVIAENKKLLAANRDLQERNRRLEAELAAAKPTKKTKRAVAEVDGERSEEL